MFGPRTHQFFVGRRRRLTGVGVILAVLITMPGIASALSNGEAHRDASFTLGEVNRETGAAAIHDRGITGAGVTVAVIDTGVDEVPGLDGPGKVVQGPDLSFEAGNPAAGHRDSYGHGTVMASIIAGDDGHADGYVGVAPGAQILSVKVADRTGRVDVSQVIAALDWVVAHGRDEGMNVRVINLSYRTDSSQDPEESPLVAAVERAWAAGFVVVASAGNDGKSKSLGHPAVSPYVIAVASSSEIKGGLESAVYSSTGKGGGRRPDLAAPGSRILGLGAPESQLVREHPEAFIDGRFFRGTGTSQAAAVVSGTVALMLEARPAMTPDQVKASLLFGADDVGNRGSSAIGRADSKAFQEMDKALDRLAELEQAVDESVSQFDALVATGARAKDIAKAQQRVDDARGKVAEQHQSVAAARSDVYAAMDKALQTWDLKQLGKMKFDKKIGAGWINILRAIDIEPRTLAVQTHHRSDGSGSLEAARGSSHVDLPDGSVLVGEVTFTGDRWTGATWSTRFWSGATWSGATWSGATWSGATWSGATWSGATWSGATWSGATWSGATWSGATWSGVLWE